jgi:hypothetical protein
VGATARARARAAERSSTDGEEISQHGLGRKVQEIRSVQDLGMRLGARDSGFFPFVGSVRRGNNGVERHRRGDGGGPTFRHRAKDRRGARQDKATNVARR